MLPTKTTLILLDAGLDQLQVVGLEALEAPEGPVARVVVGVLVHALQDLRTNLVGITAMGQLQDQVVHDRSVVIVEQLHLVEDTLDVALGRVILWEVPLAVLGHQLVRDG